MNLAIKKLIRLDLVKVGILTMVSVGFKMTAMFGINKILAIYVGPSGYALVGQFQNFIQIIAIFGGGAINTGVTKYTAEYEGNPTYQHRLWSTALILTVAGAISTTLVITVFRVDASIWLLNDPQYADIFIWLGISFIFLVLNTLLLAILNGKESIGLYVLANIAGSATAFLVTLYLTNQKGLWGALAALSIYQGLAFFSTILIIKNAKWFSIKYFIDKPDYEVVKNLIKYIFMAATSALCAPIANIIIRNDLITKLDNSSAGYWEAMSRVSGGYLLIFTSALTVYFIPKFSKLNDLNKIQSEIKNGYKIILPFVILSSLTIYLFRNSIILILFTEKFLPIGDLFFWFIFGDILKVGSWIISFLMLSKAMTKAFISLEILFTFIYIMLNLILINILGLKGTGLAYTFTYLLYWATLHFFIKKYYFKK
jgi:PST family polysaccharide transporter